LIYKELPDFTRLVSLELQATLAPRCTPLQGTPPESFVLTFASPSETRWSECGPASSLHDHCGPCSESTELLSWACPKIRPSTDVATVRPLPVLFWLSPSRHFRPVDTIEPIRSVPVVSHDLNGLLRTELCRSIAPCCQS